MLPGGFDVAECMKEDWVCRADVGRYIEAVKSACAEKTRLVCGRPSTTTACVDRYIPASGPLPESDLFTEGLPPDVHYESLRRLSRGGGYNVSATGRPDLEQRKRRARELERTSDMQTDPFLKIDHLMAAIRILRWILDETSGARRDSDAHRLFARLNDKLKRLRKLQRWNCVKPPTVEYIPGPMPGIRISL